MTKNYAKHNPIIPKSQNPQILLPQVAMKDGGVYFSLFMLYQGRFCVALITSSMMSENEAMPRLVNHLFLLFFSFLFY
jgi:hypothetical protein